MKGKRKYKNNFIHLLIPTGLTILQEKVMEKLLFIIRQRSRPK